MGMITLMSYSALTHLECSRCGLRHDAGQVQGTCSCGSPLLARYDIAAVSARLSPAEIAARPPDLWRYHELLPVCDPGRVVTLGEGMTPLLAMPRLGQAIGVPRLWMKDEGLAPTGTFKARGAAVGVSRAAELGLTGVAMPSNGNAGAAWATYAARAGLRSLIVMPAAAPPVTFAECAAAGAELYLVDGLIGDAGAIIAAALPGRPGYQDVSTLREPYRLEGKKTMGYEIAEQLGWRLPDVIVYPAGGGVGIIGIHKALRELRELGWVEGSAAPAGRGAGQRLRADRGGVRQRRRREPALAGRPDRRLRHHGPQGARRFPGAQRGTGDRGDRRRRDRRGAARGPARDRAPGRQPDLPRGSRLRHGRPAAPRVRLAGGQR